MAKRSAREFACNFEQQFKTFKPVRVNPFPIMLDAAKNNSSSSSSLSATSATTAGTSMGTTSNTNSSLSCSSSSSTLAASRSNQLCGSSVGSIPCAHCGAALSDLAAQQCHSCKNVYCPSCSVMNYAAREDRMFCLDCHQEATFCCSDHHFEQDDENHDPMMSHYSPQRNAFISTRTVYVSRGSGESGFHIAGSTGKSGSSGSSSRLVQACSAAAAAAAAMVAAASPDCHNPLSGPSGISSSGSSSSSSFLAGPHSFLAGSGSCSLTPVTHHGACWGVLLPTSPVIPFFGSMDDGYMGLANRVVDHCATAAADDYCS